MKSRSSWIGLALLAAVVAAWWILQPDGQGVQHPTDADPAEQESLEEAQITSDALLDATDPELDSSDEASEREEVTLGHRILVLGLDGLPVADVPLATWLEQEEGQFRGLIERLVPGEIPGNQIHEKAPRTNADGILQLATDQGLFVWTAWNGLTGWVYIPMGTDLNESPHTLQLQSAHTVEVMVLDAAGEPVKGRLRFDSHLGPVKELDIQAEDLEPGDYGSAWHHAPNQVFTGADSRRYFKLSAPQHTRERMGENPGKLRYRLTFNHNGVQYEPRIFEEDRTDPIVFQLDGTGSLSLRLIEYPEGVLPVIRLAGSKSATLEGKLQDGTPAPTWEFEGLKIGGEWEVDFLFERTEVGGARSRDRFHLPPSVIAGPQVAGERVESEIRFAFPPGFHGKLVDQSGQVITDLSQLGSMQCQLLFSAGHRYADHTEGSVLDDGRFFVALLPERLTQVDISNIRGAEIEFRQRKPHGAPEDWVAERVWANFDATVASAQSSVDVGDVVVETENPLLLVSVRDHLGQPMRQARVNLEYAAHWEQETLQSDRFLRVGRSVFTDAIGEAWFIGRDWRSHLSKMGFGSGIDPSFEIHTLRVSAELEGYLSPQVEIPVSQREVVVELTPAATLVGSMLAIEGAHFEIRVLPAGSDSEESLGRSMMRRRQGEALIPFSIEGLAPGQYDVVFLLQGVGGGQELMRVANVVIQQPGVHEDPRLQDLDFSDALNVMRLRLLHADGQPLSADEVHAAEFRDRAIVSGGGGMTGAEFDGLEAIFVIPKENENPRHLMGEGYRAVRVDNLGPGSHDVRLEALKETRVRIQGRDQLPEGVQLSCWISTPSDVLAYGYHESLEEDEFSVYWRVAGAHSITWYLATPNGWSDRAGIEFEVSEDLMENGGSIDLAIPQELIDKIPQD